MYTICFYEVHSSFRMMCTYTISYQQTREGRGGEGGWCEEGTEDDT